MMHFETSSETQGKACLLDTRGSVARRHRILLSVTTPV